MQKWVVSAKKADFQQIAEKYKIDPVTARIIRNRDIIKDQDIDQYLNGTLADLHNPHLMRHMDLAVNLLTEKIKDGKKIRIIGDYDIDGVNAAYILMMGLKHCNAVVDTEIPDRMKDGYGINEHLIKLAYDAGIDTIITCDNGISAIDQIQYAKELGMTVIVTDHHDVPYIEMEDGTRRILTSMADAIVNPKQKECNYPFKELCGAAVAFKFVQCLYEKFQVSEDKIWELLPFAAFATVGDVMDLAMENRIIVKYGLKMLQNTENLGMRALIQMNGIEEKKLSVYHIGFVLGPCLNATGRLDTAKRALELLWAESVEEANTLASELLSLNESRKEMTKKGLEKALALIEDSSLKDDKVLIIYLEDCHESLAGIIAGRIREKYNKPVFVLTKAEEGIKGSGRSIEAYSMYEEMVKCRTLIKKFGGHPMAAGLSLDEDKVELFQRAMNENTTLEEADFVPKILIDVPMPMDYVQMELVEEFEKLEPFGKGNQKPVFADKEVCILSGRILGKNKNVLKMQLKALSGKVHDGIYFGNIEEFQHYIDEKFGKVAWEQMLLGRPNDIRMSFVYYPSINEYNGNKNLQMVLQHYC